METTMQGNSSTGKQLEEAPPPRLFGKWISRSKTKNSGTAEESSSADDVAKDLKNRSTSAQYGQRSKAAGRMRPYTEAKMMEEMEAETESPTDDSASTVDERQAAKLSQPSSSKRTEKLNTASASAIVFASPPGKTKMSTAPQTPKISKSLGKPQLDLDLPNWEHPSPAPIKSPTRITRSVSRPKSSSEKKTKKTRPGKEENQLEADATDHSEAASSIADDDDASYISTGTQSNMIRVPSLRSIGSDGSKKSTSSMRRTSSSSSRHAPWTNLDADDMSQGSRGRRGRLDGHESQHSLKSIGGRPMFEIESDSEGDISMDEFFSGCGVQETPVSPKIYSEITLQMPNLSASASILAQDDLEFDPMDDPTTMSPKRDKRSKLSRDYDARPDKSPTKDARGGSTPRRSRKSSFKAPPALDSSADTLDSSISEQCLRKGAGASVIHRQHRSKKNDRALVLVPDQQALDCSTSLSSLELLSVDTDDDQRTSDDGCSTDGLDITTMTDEQLAELEEKMLRTAMEKSLTGSGTQLDVSAADPTPLTGGKRPNRRAPPSLTCTARPSNMLSSSFNTSCASLDLRDITGGEDPSRGLDDENEIVNSLANMSPEDLAKLEEKMLKMAMHQSLNESSNIDTNGGGGGGDLASSIQMSTTEAYDRKMASFSQPSRPTRNPPSATPASPLRLPLTTPLSAASPSRVSSEIHSPRVRAELISPATSRPRQPTGSSSPARYTSTSQQSPRHSSRSTTPGTVPSYPDRHNGSGSYPRSSERSSGSRTAVAPAPLYGSDRVNSGSSVCSYASIDSSATDPNTATRLAEIEQEDVLVEMAIQESLREADASGRSQRSSVPYDSFSVSSRSAVPGQGRPAAPPRNITCNNTQYLGRSMFRSTDLSDDESEDDELELADAPLPTIPQSYPTQSPRCRTQSADCFDNSRIQAMSRRPARLDSYVKQRPTDKAMI